MDESFAHHQTFKNFAKNQSLSISNTKIERIHVWQKGQLAAPGSCDKNIIVFITTMDVYLKCERILYRCLFQNLNDVHNL